MIFEPLRMDAEQAIEEAISLANLGAMPEGPKGQLESIGLAQAYALISIARSLMSLVGIQQAEIGYTDPGYEVPEPIHLDESGNTGEIDYSDLPF